VCGPEIAPSRIRATRFLDRDAAPPYPGRVRRDNRPWPGWRLQHAVFWR
jgi:hypothetical protein